MPDLFSPRVAVLCATALLAPNLWAAPSASSAPAANTRLRDTPWTLQTLAGTPVANSRTHLTLEARSQHLSGSAGCNRLRGRYTQRGTQLALKPIATTRMACEPDVMQQEALFLQTVSTTDSYRIEGRVLSLLEGDAVKATFIARAPRKKP